MNTPVTSSASVERFLGRLENSARPAPPRALVVDSEGETLFDSGDASLPLAMAGITKLFTLAMVLREVDRGALSLDTLLADILPVDTVRGLCVVGGEDHSFAITIEHLLRHRSGIVDYTQPGHRQLRSLSQQFLEHDRSWSLEQALEIAKHYPGKNKPGAGPRAYYSSTNYLLLGAVLHDTTGMPFDELIRLRIVGSLGLQNTYVFGPDHYEKYFTLSPIHRESRVVRIPQALASSGADGAIVSTAHDALAFLRAFWRGELFQDTWIPRLTATTSACNASPRMGLGVMVAPARLGKGPVVGHSGISGVGVAIDTQQNHSAFLTNFQWSPPATSFNNVTGLLRNALS
ncbi:MAG: beta-lactamase family protein [Pontimonas sp.]|nr:beta-lactamase family protein [Pontimonas sp.]